MVELATLIRKNINSSLPPSLPPPPAAEVVILEEMKKAKEAEIDKYKKYLNKAKKIIENIGETKSQVAEDSLEVSTCQCTGLYSIILGHMFRARACI